MSKIKVFSLAFDDKQFSSIPTDEHIVKVNLNKLSLVNGIKNENQEISEGRIFLSKLVDSYLYADDSPEFVGFTSWRYNEKHTKKSIVEWKHGDWQQGTVYAVALMDNWYEHSCYYHPGIQKYLLEMSEITGLKYWLPNGFYFNNFACSKEIYSDFQVFFRKVFMHFHNKYKYNYDYTIRPDESYNERVNSGAYIGRMSATLYERIACLYFSNRTDLKFNNLL